MAAVYYLTSIDDIFVRTRSNSDPLDYWTDAVEISGGTSVWSGGSWSAVGTTTGKIFVSWIGNNDIYFAAYDGSSWTTPVVVFAEAGDSAYIVDVATDGISAWVLGNDLSNTNLNGDIAYSAPSSYKRIGIKLDNRSRTKSIRNTPSQFGRMEPYNNLR